MRWYGTHTYTPNGEWDRVAEDMMLNFCESGHPVFRGSSALERDLERTGKGKLSIHFKGSDETGGFSYTHFRQSAQYLRSAVADMCAGLAWEISKCSEGTGRPTRSTGRFEDHGNAKRIVDNKSNSFDR